MVTPMVTWQDERSRPASRARGHFSTIPLAATTLAWLRARRRTSSIDDMALRSRHGEVPSRGETA